MEQSLFVNEVRERNYEKKRDTYLSRPPRERRYTQHEIIMDFLKENPDTWFYVWEIMGDRKLGFVSYKCNTRLAELINDGLVVSRPIGKYAVYSVNRARV